ncbi:MAG: sigma 54-dependent Fis family transcriptional regulator [Myxococcales bacterium]|nr:sigma 54-dependent Fis family transcriptional regulator [Myxococcales bacterium]
MTDDGFDAQTELTRNDPRPVAVSARVLRVRWRDGDGERVADVTRRSVVGSSASADLVVIDPAVSRLHCELEPRPDGVWIRDLGSRNGTFVNGVMVTGARLPRSARIVLGSTELECVESNEPRPVELWPASHFGPLVGESVAMRALFQQLSLVAPSNAAVLVHGETGTGKELVARALHEASPRARGPYVIVDCAALPESLLDAELFGHTKGAFTGANTARAGAIELADGGTVFLDEIGELPLQVQPKLLRAIESHTVRRLGESAHRKVDVRFVSATHRDLREMVNAGTFREDLLFRLAVLQVDVPPLRARPEDIVALVRHFVGATAAIDPLVIDELRRRPWFGNVRELRNFVERAKVLGAGAALASLPSASAPVRRGDPLPPVSPDAPFKDLRERWLDHFEREYLSALLARHNRNVTAVATAAGLDRTYVHRLMKKHEL